MNAHNKLSPTMVSVIYLSLALWFGQAGAECPAGRTCRTCGGCSSWTEAPSHKLSMAGTCDCPQYITNGRCAGDSCYGWNHPQCVNNKWVTSSCNLDLAAWGGWTLTDGIATITNGTFSSILQLNWVRLWQNQLEYMDVDTFRNNAQLLTLDLNQNLLSRLDAENFITTRNYSILTSRTINSHCYILRPSSITRS